MKKKDFNKLWENSTINEILNQYYYDYKRIIYLSTIIRDVREYIERYLKLNLELFDTQDLLEKLLEIVNVENI